MASEIKLEDYHISEEVGFLMRDPLEKLPPYFQRWNELSKKVSHLVQKHQFRDEIDTLPVLDHTVLRGHRQKRLAHLQLSLMTSGYVWQEGPNNPPKYLPAGLAIPLWEVSQEIGVPPVIGYSSLFIVNWGKNDENRGLELENIRCLYTPYFHPDVLNFFSVTLRMEMDFGPAAKGIVDGLKCIAEDNEEGLMSALGRIEKSLGQMKNTFSKVHTLTSPEVFFTKLVPYFNGFGEEGSPLPNGLIFEGVSSTPVKAPRASGAMTCTLQATDAFLGVKHNPEARMFMESIRKSFTPCHKKFVEKLESMPSTRDYVNRSENEFLKVAYDDCLSALVDFRNYHIRIVAKYVIVVGAKERKKDKTMINPFPKSPEGAYPMPLLKKIRSESDESKSLQNK
ncbi:indoleamine 2,3-dioxygenase 2-like [Liolophura sinensis]|uniref:indoleamine 2,3-dioxygenase 2-like n=1 Tax=Liolophura sinensis TaxID=3198878 RepID=UPI0031587B70